jgi:glycosyltransferase involved in cell wall biosynthesis
MPAMTTPLVSVILVCRNPGARAREALQSVWAQRDAETEVIVIDGASTDGTREWLQTQRGHLDTLISEPDGGIYEAMNKGIAAARGEWVLFLGADDRLAGDDVLARAAVFLEKTGAGVLVGAARFDDGRLYRLAPASAFIRRNFMHHQAAFYRHSRLARTGGFDATLRLQADYDLNLRLHRTAVRFDVLDLLVTECASGGLSDAGHWANYREEIAVRHRHFSAWQCWLWDAGSVVRYVRKKILLSFARQRPE